MTAPFRSRIALLKPQRTPDEGGGASRAFAQAATFWAAVDLVAATAGEGGGRPARRRRIRAFIRTRSDVALGDRLRFDGADYVIVSIESDADSDRRLVLFGEEAQS